MKSSLRYYELTCSGNLLPLFEKPLGYKILYTKREFFVALARMTQTQRKQVYDKIYSEVGVFRLADGGVLEGQNLNADTVDSITLSDIPNLKIRKNTILHDVK